MSEQICNLKKLGGSGGTPELEIVLIKSFNFNGTMNGTYTNMFNISDIDGYQNITKDQLLAATTYIIQNSLQGMSIESYDPSTGGVSVTFYKPYTGTLCVYLFLARVKTS